MDLNKTDALESTLHHEFEEQEDEETQSRLRQILGQNEVTDAEELDSLSTQVYDNTLLHSDLNRNSNNAPYAMDDVYPRLLDFEHSANFDTHHARSGIEKIQQALHINGQLKNALQEQLLKIEAAQQRNNALQRDIRLRIAQQRAIHTHRVIVPKKQSLALQKKSADAYFFADENEKKPSDNPDATKRKLKQQKIPLVYNFKKWTTTELKALKDAVKQSVQQVLFQEIMKKHESNKTPGSVNAFLRDVNEVKNLSDEDYDNAIEKVDWVSVCKFSCPGRTPYECEKKWKNELSSRINKRKWTREEEKQLLELAKKNLGHNWPELAKAVGDGNRTAFHVLQKFQRSLNVNMMKSKWTEEEDKILTAAVEYYGEKNWQQVAQSLSGRAGQQCLHRWMKTLNPKIKKGRWSIEEDKRLMMAVHAYGLTQDTHPWIKIKEHVPGRTDVQCRERWCNILNPELNSGPWTEEEDERLRHAISVCGVGRWSQISEMCKPRTDNQCWRRWKTLNSDEVQEYKKKIQKKEMGLVKNFVGREKERPKIEVDDVEVECEDDDNVQSSQPATYSTKKGKSKRGPKGRRKYKPEVEASAPPQPVSRTSAIQGNLQTAQNAQRQFMHLQPILAMEFRRQQEIKFIMEKKQMFVGVEPSPFVTASLNKLRHMASYEPSGSSTSEPNSENTSDASEASDTQATEKKKDVHAFTEPLPLTQPGLLHLPAIQPTKTTFYALATLQRLLYERDTPINPTPVEDNTSEDKGKSTENAVDAEENSTPSTQTPINYGVNEHQHVDPATIDTPEFRALASVFNGLFQHSMQRVMATTATVVPYQLRRVPMVNLLNSYFHQEQQRAQGSPQTRSIQNAQQASILQLYQMQNPQSLEIRQPPSSNIRLETAKNTQIAAKKRKQTDTNEGEQPVKKKRGRPRRTPLPVEEPPKADETTNDTNETNETSAEKSPPQRKLRAVRRKKINSEEEEQESNGKRKRKESDDEYVDDSPKRKSKRSTK
jgi:hypothetical protein